MRAHCVLVVGVLVASLAQTQSLAAAPRFEGLGDLPGGPFRSGVYGISGDGSRVVGIADSTFNAGQAFVWRDGVMSGLGDLPGGFFHGTARGANADGSVVVGYSSTQHGYRAFRWEAGVMSDLGSLPPGTAWSAATAVSADGSVVAGVSGTPSGQREAFRWEDGVMTALRDPPAGVSESSPLGVSADGTVVVGWASSSNRLEAFVWESGMMTALGYLPGGSSWAEATAISADGSVVVGWSESEESPLWEAFRSQDGVMTGLGGLTREYVLLSEASDASADGSVVVGRSRIGMGDYRPFIWTEDTGILNLMDVLTAFGLDLSGWILTDAVAVSDDGLTIAGNAYSPNGEEGWIATLPADWIDQVSYALTVTIAKSGLAEWGTVAVEPNLPAYAVGRTVTLTALPNGDNAFKKWKLYDPNHPGDANHVVTDTNDVLTLVMMSDREVVAVFKCASGTPLLPALTLAAIGLFVLIRRRA